LVTSAKMEDAPWRRRPARSRGEFVDLFDASEVGFLIVGGYSVAHHGFPRYPGDFDVWIEPSVENGAKMVRVMEQFGFGALGITAEDFIQPDKVIQVPNECQLHSSRIDFNCCSMLSIGCFVIFPAKDKILAGS